MNANFTNNFRQSRVLRKKIFLSHGGEQRENRAYAQRFQDRAGKCDNTEKKKGTVFLGGQNTEYFQ